MRFFAALAAVAVAIPESYERIAEKAMDRTEHDSEKANDHVERVMDKAQDKAESIAERASDIVDWEYKKSEQVIRKNKSGHDHAEVKEALDNIKKAADKLEDTLDKLRDTSREQLEKAEEAAEKEVNKNWKENNKEIKHPQKDTDDKADDKKPSVPAVEDASAALTEKTPDATALGAQQLATDLAEAQTSNAKDVEQGKTTEALNKIAKMTAQLEEELSKAQATSSPQDAAAVQDAAADAKAKLQDLLAALDKAKAQDDLTDADVQELQGKVDLLQSSVVEYTKKAHGEAAPSTTGYALGGVALAAAAVGLLVRRRKTQAAPSDYVSIV